MKTVILEICKESSFSNNYIECGMYSMYDIAIQINLNGKNINDILMDKDEWIKSKEYEIYVRKTVGDKYDFIEEEFDYVINNLDKIYEMIEFINLDKEIDIRQFLKDNPKLQTKKIVLNGYLDIYDFDKLDELYNEYKDLNVYVALQGNSEHVNLKECKKTMDYIKSIGEMVASLNLSPFETTLFVYDIVRDRYYKYEEEDDRYTESRDLTKVLFGDSIVCLGYSHIFSSILNYLGIENRITHLDLKNKETGHARNEVIINDSKYNINGCYYFDATWDSKVKGREKEYLLSYRFAARTRDEMESFENHKYIYEKTSKYSKNMVKELENLINNHDVLGCFPYIKTFNHISYVTNSNLHLDVADFIGGKINFEDIKDDLNNMLKKYNQPIYAETYLKALNEVRKIEYYMNPEKNSYTLQDFYCIFMNSNWKFKRHYYTLEDRLLMSIFGKVPNKENTKQEDFKNFVSLDFNCLKDIKCVTLTKILSNELERRKNEETKLSK